MDGAGRSRCCGTNHVGGGRADGHAERLRDGVAGEVAFPKSQGHARAGGQTHGADCNVSGGLSAFFNLEDKRVRLIAFHACGFFSPTTSEDRNRW